jgi:hypothetical protein
MQSRSDDFVGPMIRIRYMTGNLPLRHRGIPKRKRDWIGVSTLNRQPREIDGPSIQPRARPRFQASNLETLAD